MAKAAASLRVRTQQPRCSVKHGPSSPSLLELKMCCEQVSVWVSLQRCSSAEDIMSEEGVLRWNCECRGPCMRAHFVQHCNWSSWSPLNVNVCAKGAGQEGRLKDAVFSRRVNKHGNLLSIYVLTGRNGDHEKKISQSCLWWTVWGRSSWDCGDRRATCELAASGSLQPSTWLTLMVQF